MPRTKPRKVIKRATRNKYRRNNGRRRPRTFQSGPQVLSAHRRLVLYPNHTNASWLSKLAWFSGVALRLFKLVVGINDDFTATEKTTAAGTAIFLGPGDFATVSSFAVPADTPDTADKEVKCLKAFPFERVGLHRITLKIVPSADMSVRGGMYAALIVPVDAVDSQLMFGEGRAQQLVKKYSAKYDDIIKHPRAKLGSVTSTLNLSINLPGTPHSIRVRWNNETGFVNAFPSCALLVAFSDLAATENAVESGYDPTKSLFEVHLNGKLTFHEPSELTSQFSKAEAENSLYTPKLLTSESKSINATGQSYSSERTVTFFDRDYRLSEPLNLFDLPRKHALEMLNYYGREDLKADYLKRIKYDNVITTIDSFDMCDE